MGLSVGPSATISHDLAELFELWESLDSTAQAELLTLARGMARSAFKRGKVAAGVLSRSGKAVNERGAS